LPPRTERLCIGGNEKSILAAVNKTGKGLLKYVGFHGHHSTAFTRLTGAFTAFNMTSFRNKRVIRAHLSKLNGDNKLCRICQIAGKTGIFPQ